MGKTNVFRASDFIQLNSNICSSFGRVGCAEEKTSSRTTAAVENQKSVHIWLVWRRKNKLKYFTYEWAHFFWMLVDWITLITSTHEWERARARTKWIGFDKFSSVIFYLLVLYWFKCLFWIVRSAQQSFKGTHTLTHRHIQIRRNQQIGQSSLIICSLHFRAFGN